MCSHCEWEDLIEQIDILLSDEEFEFAHDTLDGIRSWVEENEHCTDSQKAAVQNIENSR